jgi:hypothetical protein
MLTIAPFLQLTNPLAKGGFPCLFSMLILAPWVTNSCFYINRRGHFVVLCYTLGECRYWN